MKKLTNILFLMIALTTVLSCTIKRKAPKLKGHLKSEERVSLVRDFAVEVFSRCEKEDYSEIKGFRMDVNMTNRLQPEKLRKLCYYYNKKYGVVTVGELNKAESSYYTKDFLDYFTFSAKASKNDSLQSVRVQIYRDDNMIEGLIIPKYKSKSSR